MRGQNCSSREGLGLTRVVRNTTSLSKSAQTLGIPQLAPGTGSRPTCPLSEWPSLGGTEGTGLCVPLSSSSCTAEGGMSAGHAQHSLLVGEGTRELVLQVKPSLPGKSLPAFYDCSPPSQGCLFGSPSSGPGWEWRAVFLWDFITCFVSQGVSVGLPSSSPLLHHYPLFSFHQPCTDPTHGREATGSTWHLPEISLAKTPTAEPCCKLCVD